METQQNMNMENNAAGGFLNDMEKFFHGLYVKVPWHLPAKGKEFIVKVGPIITLIVIIFAIPVVLLALGIGTFMAPYAMMYGGMHAGGGFLVSGIISLAALILEAISLPGLFSRSLKGWQFAYYASLVSALGNLVRFDIVGLILGLVISLYVLFEIKSYYH